MRGQDASNGECAERARERLGRYGARELETAELLALLGIEEVAGGAPVGRLAEGDGPPRLVAAVELGRRVLRDLDSGRVLSDPAAVAAHVRPRLAMESVEVFYMLGVDVKNRVVIEREVARGTVSRVDVHPRDVFRPAIAANCAAVLVAHNHPSGDPAPSPDDFELTRRLVEAGRILGIPVLDHVVVAGERFRSAL